MLINLQNVVPHLDYEVVVIHEGFTEDDMSGLGKVCNCIKHIPYTLHYLRKQELLLIAIHILHMLNIRYLISWKLINFYRGKIGNLNKTPRWVLFSNQRYISYPDLLFEVNQGLLDDSDKFTGTVSKDIVMNPAFCYLSFTVSIEGGIVFNDIASCFISVLLRPFIIK